ncbi:BppU family phage baseplate upper protein [Mammaliicoccus sciuri]|uniref:BppU family phage baseplate upper protein n=1 Tax=Mammaliicoccus sciuri TaxID=1296 RepID=UPI0020A0448C|nr:BppU family phage baseplate upper protein [Mammaliicoccus sciuri]MCP1288348.1 BppU family phage baseplate upper protein [Mammaliicoccus sciuri]
MVIFKNKDINTNISEHGADLGNINVNFYTEDNGTASIRIYIKKDGKAVNLNNINMVPRLDLYAQDKSVFTNEPLDIIMPEQGLIQYRVTDYAIRHEGKMDCKLFLVNGNDSVHVANFYFIIKDSGVTGAVGKEIQVDILEDMVRSVMTDNAMGLLDESYKEKISEDLKEFVYSNDEVFKGPKGDKLRFADLTEIDKQELKGDPFTYEDFTNEQIEELREPIKEDVVNIDSRVKKIHGLSTTAINIYVDKTGTDNGNGTQSNPFNSIQKAFDSIPKIIDKRYTVWITPGEYEEEAYLTGVIGGTIFVRSTEPPETVDNINVRVKALNFYDIMGYVHIEDMGTFGGEMTRKAFIMFSRCIYGSVSRCRMDRTIPGKITLYWDGSFGSLGTSHLSNQELCIQSQNGSTVRIDDNTTSGTGNVVALYSLNGFIFKSGPNNWIQSASIPEKKEIGGQIYSDKIEWNTLTFLNGWATQSGAALKYKKISDDLVFLYGWVNKQPLDLTTIATLPVGVRPVNTQRNLVTVTGTAVIQDAPPVLTINSNGEIKLVNVGTVPPNNGIAINLIYPIK